MDENKNVFSSSEGLDLEKQSYSYTPNQNYGYTPNSQFEPEEPKTPQPPKKNFGLGTIILCIIISAAIGAGSAVLALGSDRKGSTDGTPSDTVSASIGSSNIEDTSNNSTSNITISGNIESIVEAVYEKSAKSCVGIRTKVWVQSIFGSSQKTAGEGSGVIYKSNGYIITNYHVIADVINDYSENSSVEVFLMSDPQNPVEAKIVGYNISADLAVVKIEKTKLPAIELADSSTIKVGQYAVAIGCPGGIEFLNSVSYGTISGLNRTITIDAIGEMDLIQTDAAINPGNSGGALLNSKGQLIGINSSKLVDESFEGMGFAIPTNNVKKVVDEIVENKNPSPYIGIEIYKFNSEYLKKYNLPAGAAVKNVVPNAPADKAGIENGHIITQFNGVEIKEYTDFIDALEKCKPGDKVTVRMYKEHRYETTTVTIGSNNSYG